MRSSFVFEYYIKKLQATPFSSSVMSAEEAVLIFGELLEELFSELTPQLDRSKRIDRNNMNALVFINYSPD